MKQVLDIQIGVTYDATLTIANFATKAIGATNMADVETGAVASTSTRVLSIITVCADSDGNLYLGQSPPIHQNNIVSESGNVFAASVTKEIDFTITGLVVVAGDEYVFWITDLNDYNYILPRRRMSYVATEADAVAANPDQAVAAGIVAAVNADVSEPNVTATNLLAVITITGKAVTGSGNVINNFRSAPEILFGVTLADNLSQFVASIAITDPDPGCGVSREVRKLEEIHKGNKGHLNRVIYPTSSNIQYKTVPATDYDLISIEHNGPQHTNTEGDVHAQLISYTALPAGVGVGVGSLYADLAPVLVAMK